MATQSTSRAATEAEARPTSAPGHRSLAFVELINWLVADYGFAKADAYQLVSQVAVVRVANMVDPLYTVVAKFPKAHLPATAATTTAGSPVAAPRD